MIYLHKYTKLNFNDFIYMNYKRIIIKKSHQSIFYPLKTVYDFFILYNQSHLKKK